VLELPCDHRFPEERVTGARVVGDDGQERLDRHLASEGRLPPEGDAPHPPVGERPEDLDVAARSEVERWEARGGGGDRRLRPRIEGERTMGVGPAQGLVGGGVARVDPEAGERFLKVAGRSDGGMIAGWSRCA